MLMKTTIFDQKLPNSNLHSTDFSFICLLCDHGQWPEEWLYRCFVNADSDAGTVSNSKAGFQLKLLLWTLILEI